MAEHELPRIIPLFRDGENLRIHESYQSAGKDVVFKPGATVRREGLIPLGYKDLPSGIAQNPEMIARHLAKKSSPAAYVLPSDGLKTAEHVRVELYGGHVIALQNEHHGRHLHSH